MNPPPPPEDDTLDSYRENREQEIVVLRRLCVTGMEFEGR